MTRREVLSSKQGAPVAPFATDKPACTRRPRVDDRAALSGERMTASAIPGRKDHDLVGVWARDEGFQIVELLFRSDGRYQLDQRSTDPTSGFAWTDRGRHELGANALVLWLYDRLGEAQGLRHAFELAGDTLSLTRVDLEPTQA